MFELEEIELTDGSKVFNVVLHYGVGKFVRLHCAERDEALMVIDLLEHTVIDID